MRSEENLKIEKEIILKAVLYYVKLVVRIWILEHQYFELAPTWSHYSLLILCFWIFSIFFFQGDKFHGNRVKCTPSAPVPSIYIHGFFLNIRHAFYDSYKIYLYNLFLEFSFLYQTLYVILLF